MFVFNSAKLKAIKQADVASFCSACFLWEGLLLSFLVHKESTSQVRKELPAAWPEKGSLTVISVPNAITPLLATDPAASDLTVT